MKKTFYFLKSLFFVVFVALTMTSCFTTKTGVRTDKIMVDDFPRFRENCIGQTHNQIVTQLGAPQRESSDGAGGTILIYENTTTTTISNSLASAYNINVIARTYTPGVNTTTEQTTNTDYIHYFINSDHVCYEVKTNIPMRREEESEPYEYKYKEMHLGKTMAVVLGPLVGLAVFSYIMAEKSK